LVSSVAMTIPGQTPASLNSWLTSHHGFANGDGFIWRSVAPFGLVFEGFNNNKASLKKAFKAGKIVILNVRGGHHWVLTTGITKNGFAVNDPGFRIGSYTDG
jgi:hypothetical protein